MTEKSVKTPFSYLVAEQTLLHRSSFLLYSSHNQRAQYKLGTHFASTFESSIHKKILMTIQAFSSVFRYTEIQATPPPSDWSHNQLIVCITTSVKVLQWLVLCKTECISIFIVYEIMVWFVYNVYNFYNGFLYSFVCLFMLKLLWCVFVSVIKSINLWKNNLKSFSDLFIMDIWIYLSDITFIFLLWLM